MRTAFMGLTSSRCHGHPHDISPNIVLPSHFPPTTVTGEVNPYARAAAEPQAATTWKLRIRWFGPLGIDEFANKHLFYIEK